MRSSDTVEAAKIRCLERIVELYGGALLRHAQRKGLNKEDAEEIVNDVFHKYFLKFDPEKGPERSWLYKVTNNLCVDFLRKQQRDKEKTEFVAMTEGMQIPNPGNFEEKHKVQNDKLNMAIESLSDEKRAILKLYYGQRYRQKEIAEMLGIKRGTVAKHISDIKTLVKSFLER